MEVLLSYSEQLSALGGVSAQEQQTLMEEMFQTLSPQEQQQFSMAKQFLQMMQTSTTSSK